MTPDVLTKAKIELNDFTYKILKTSGCYIVAMMC